MPSASRKYAIIIGAGPAGLTAAYELLSRTDFIPIVLEKSEDMGGISRTVNYKGNRIDIGGHRFFSKSDRVMDWWLRMMPLEAGQDASADLRYHGMRRPLEAPSQGDGERTMLLRPRRSRIYYLRRFFDYPISLSANTLHNLGLWRVFRIGLSYLRSALFPRRQEVTLEDFFINRFGRVLYETFFQSYTEKVWGVPCHELSAEWGAQRIKGLSIWETLKHALTKMFRDNRGGLAQKDTQTSLIEQFLYPRLGPGQMWEEVARRVREMGGKILTGHDVQRMETDGKRVTAVEAVRLADGATQRFEGEVFFSTAPVKELLRDFSPPPPANVREVAEGLVYRDFITVGLLVRGLRIFDETPQGRRLVSDNWIYIQEPDVQLGRLQVFNNWSPYLVARPDTVWLGLEYFCYESDALWRLSDAEMIDLGRRELEKIGILETGAVLDATVLRVPKTYPAYFGSYDRFQEIRDFVDRFENLFLVGRNGMHRYNNQDHSMLTAMTAVNQLAEGRLDKAALWEINTEMDYHEEKGE